MAYWGTLEYHLGGKSSSIYTKIPHLSLKDGMSQKPKPFKHLFSTSNFASTLLNCFVLEHREFKTIEMCTSKVTSNELMLKWPRLERVRNEDLSVSAIRYDHSFVT